MSSNWLKFLTNNIGKYIDVIIVTKFGMGLNNDCASIYISKKTKCLHKRDFACMNDVNHD